MKDAALFFALPDISGIWGGPPIPQSELAGWVEGLKYFRRIDADPVLTLHTVSGNAFELYGKSHIYLNPVRLARYCCYAIQSHSVEDNTETFVQAAQAWQSYTAAVTNRIGAPDEVDPEGHEAVWRKDGPGGPTLRLWLNVGKLTPDGHLALSALVRLDVHAPEETQRSDVARGPVGDAIDTPDWYPPQGIEGALNRAHAEYEAGLGDDELRELLTEMHTGAVECGGSVRHLLGQLYEIPVEPQPGVQSFPWARTFRHPRAPQGRLSAMHLAMELAAAVNGEDSDRRAQVLDGTPLGEGLRRYALLDPRIQDALAITGHEAAVVWTKARERYAAAAVGEILYLAPPDVVREMQRRMSAGQSAGAV